MVSNISPDATRIYQYETDLGRTSIANNETTLVSRCRL